MLKFVWLLVVVRVILYHVNVLCESLGFGRDKRSTRVRDTCSLRGISAIKYDKLMSLSSDFWTIKELLKFFMTVSI
jgi:hypothetical protein